MMDLCERRCGIAPAEEFSPRNVVQTFRLTSPDDVDPEFAGWLGEAYRVGCQQHLRG